MRKAKPYNHDQEKAYSEGRIAAAHDARRICPNYPTYDEKAAWRCGYDDGRFQIARGYDVAFATFFGGDPRG